MEKVDSNTKVLRDPQPVKVGRSDQDGNGVLILIAVGLFILLCVLFALTIPDLFRVIFIVLRYTLIGITLLLIIVSALVLIGFREQAKELLTGVINGSLTTLEIMKQVRLTIRRILKAITDFFLRFIPIYAVVTAILLYIFILYLFKAVGQTSDVTLMTIMISSVTMLFVGFLNRPQPENDRPLSHSQRFTRYFNDAFEVMLFIFFLTMDSTKIFFFPESLNTHLTAQIGSYDLMQRGFTVDGMTQVTINIVLATVGIEVTRQVLRVFAYSRQYFSELRRGDPAMERESVLKHALTRGFQENMDDIIKFVTYFTFLIIVFLLFPRLKLLAMLVVSITALILDILIPERLTAKRQEDLIGRFLARTLKI